jgi:hypothetical protein
MKYLHRGKSQHSNQHNLSYSHENQGFVRHIQTICIKNHVSCENQDYVQDNREPNNLDHVIGNSEYLHQNADLLSQDIFHGPEASNDNSI